MHRPGDLCDVQIGEADHQAPIMLCPLHEKRLCDVLAAAGMSTEVAMDSPFIRAFQVLVQIASKAIGTVELVKFQCPHCALQEFDYMTNIVNCLKPGELLNG